ncbi:hypothetical protein SprV_0602048200 [Sparganum proliferum]
MHANHSCVHFATPTHNRFQLVLGVNGHSGNKLFFLDTFVSAAPLGPHQPSSLRRLFPRYFRRQITITARLNHHFHPPPPPPPPVTPPPPPQFSPSSYSSSYPFFASCSSSYFVPTTAALAAVTHINATHIPDTSTDTTPTTSDSRGEDQDYTCLHCHRTFTSHIGLGSQLRIHRTETGEPVPGAPTYTHRTRLHCLHCTLTFMRRMGLLDHMRIHESGTDRSPDTPTTPSPTLASSPCAPITTTTTTTTTHQHSPTASTQLPPPMQVEVCFSTPSQCGFCCTGDLSLRLSRHVKRRG